jgi:hypothetical protein
LLDFSGAPEGVERPMPLDLVQRPQHLRGGARNVIFAHEPETLVAMIGQELLDIVLNLLERPVHGVERTTVRAAGQAGKGRDGRNGGVSGCGGETATATGTEGTEEWKKGYAFTGASDGFIRVAPASSPMLLL